MGYGLEGKFLYHLSLHNMMESGVHHSHFLCRFESLLALLFFLLLSTSLHFLRLSEYASYL